MLSKRETTRASLGKGVISAAIAMALAGGAASAQPGEADPVSDTEIVTVPEPEPESVTEAETETVSDAELLRLAAEAEATTEVIEVYGEAPDDAETPTYQLDPETLRSLPGAGNDTLKSLQSLPGVARVPFGGGGLVLRGASPRDTNVYLDGIEVPLLFHFGGLASFYPSSLIASVELAPGGFGAEYGRAQGGLVTIESKPGRADRWRSGGELSLLDASVRADGPVGGGTLALGLRRSWVDAVLAFALSDSDSAQFTVAPRYYDAQLRYDRTLDNGDQITVMLFGSDDELRVVTEPEEAEEADGLVFATRFARLGATWARRTDQTVLSVTPWVGYDRNELRIDGSGLARTSVPLGLRTRAVQAYARGEIAGGLDVRSQRVGIDLQNEPPPMPGLPMDETVTRTGARWASDLGFWLEGTARFGDGLLVLRPGLRLERFGLTDDWGLDPRLTVSHELPRGVKLKESIGLYHQAPVEADYDYGTPDLGSSATLQAAVGVEAPLPGEIEAGVTGFAQTSWGLVVDATTAASPISAGGRPNSGGGSTSAAFLEEQFGTWSERSNTGRGRSYGVEVLVKRATERAYAWLSYTWSRSLRRDDPSVDPMWHPYVLDQPHVLTAVASTRLGRDWRLGARVRYASGNPITPVAGIYWDANDLSYRPIDGPVLSDRLPAFFQLDVRVDRRWRRSWGELSLFLDVQNLTNRVNAEGVDYSFDYAEKTYTRGLPVFPSLGIEYVP